jgi:hypothetical protein
VGSGVGVPRVKTRGIRNIAALTVLLLALAGIACNGGDAGPPTSDIVTTIPWPGDEELRYVLKEPDGDIVGRGVLLIDVIGERTNLAQSFSNAAETNRDDLTVQVDSRTLKPFSSTRRIVNEDDVEILEVTYSEDGALIKQGDRQSGLSVPEHSYDNDTSLFLWRTIPFAEGYESSYITIITNRRSRQKVTLEVVGKEQVTVPAGQFTAWRLEVRTGNARQFAWYEDAPARRLVKYDNDRGLIFELER